MHVTTLCGLLLVCTVAAGEPVPGVPYTATVKEDRTEVRCGPSSDPKMYVTNLLRRGAQVEVVEDKGNGWLAIKPPPGSFSWINTRFVDRIGQTRSWSVVTDPDAPVPVRVGSDQVEEKPNVEGAHVIRGTQVVERGREQVADDGKWLPIDPPLGEVRFVRATAVERLNPTVADRPPTSPPPGPPVMATPAAGQGGPAPFTTIPPEVKGSQWNGQAAAPGTPAAPGSLDDLWNQAEAAEQAGRLGDAEKLYADLHDKAVNDPNHHALAMRALNRSQDLRNRQQGGSVSRYPVPGQDGRVAAVPVNAQGRPLNCYVSAGPSAGQTGAYTAARTAQPPPAQAVQGRLRRAGRNLNGYPLYALDQSDGQTRLYLCGQVGLDLEAFKGRVVEVSGPVGYYGELCKDYMLAQQVTPLPYP